MRRAPLLAVLLVVSVALASTLHADDVPPTLPAPPQGPVPPADAVPPLGPEPLRAMVWGTPEGITVQAQDMALRDLVQAIAEAAERNIVIHPAVTGTITVSIQQVPVDQALEQIAKTAGYIAVKKSAAEGGALHIQPGPKPPPKPSTGVGVAPAQPAFLRYYDVKDLKSAPPDLLSQVRRLLPGALVEEKEEILIVRATAPQLRRLDAYLQALRSGRKPTALPPTPRPPRPPVLRPEIVLGGRTATSSTRTLEAEVRALRAEVKALREEIRALRKILEKTVDQLGN